jgi:hypothetical protein
MGVVCADVAMAAISGRWESVQDRMTPQARAQFGGNRNREMLRASLRMGEDFGGPVLFHLEGEPLRGLSLMLNTVLVLGSDPLCLMARLDGQCEMHAYVEGPHRGWLARVIEDGLSTGLFRKELPPTDKESEPAPTGWTDVVTLLRARDDQPVVTSYSVSGWFPNPGICDWEPPPGSDCDAWYDLDPAKQWEMGMAALRATPDSGLELRPDRLRYPFGHCRTLLDVFA